MIHAETQIAKVLLMREFIKRAQCLPLKPSKSLIPRCLHCALIKKPRRCFATSKAPSNDTYKLCCRSREVYLMSIHNMRHVFRQDLRSGRAQKTAPGLSTRKLAEPGPTTRRASTSKISK